MRHRNITGLSFYPTMPPHDFTSRDTRPRPLAGAGGALVHADAGRPGRRRDQDRTPRHGGDDTRDLGPAVPEGRGRRTTPARRPITWAPTATSARSPATFAQPAGQALIRELVQHCDVFVENFKVGDMARYGLDYAVAAAPSTPAGLLQRHRLRPDRPLPRARRLRLRDPGHGRPDERDRRARRPAAAARRRWAWPWPTCSPACTRPWPFWPRCATPSTPAKASTSTWRCSTRRWRCWPTWAPTTWSAARCRAARATRTRTSCPTRCSRWRPPRTGTRTT